MLHQGKGTTHEGGMRVPAIFWQPDVIKPGVIRELGTTMDILPTICEMTGIELPQDRIIDGISLVPELLGEKGEEPKKDRCVYYWRACELFAIREGPWKLHFITQGSYGSGGPKIVHETPLLYQLDQDPGEQWDVANQNPDVIKRLTQLAEEHKKTIVPVKDQLAERI